MNCKLELLSIFPVGLRCFEFLLVGFGGYSNDTLLEITGDESHIFRMESKDDMSNLAGKLVNSFCNAGTLQTV